MRFWEIFRFEIYYQLRRASNWLYFGVMLGLILMMIDELAEYALTVESLVINSPIIIAEITGYANKFSLLLIAALAGDGRFLKILYRLYG